MADYLLLKIKDFFYYDPIYKLVTITLFAWFKYVIVPDKALFFFNQNYCYFSTTIYVAGTHKNGLAHVLPICTQKQFSRKLTVLGFNTSTLVGHFVSSPREREKR